MLVKIVVCGPERQVERRLRAYAALGATDILMFVYPVGNQPEASVTRTRAFLDNLAGTP